MLNTLSSSSTYVDLSGQVLGISSTGTVTSPNMYTARDLSANSINQAAWHSNTGVASTFGTTTFNTPINFSSNQNTKQIMQNKVAVFHVVRDENDKIIMTEFIKELWVETKNGQTVDFAVARDIDLAEYEASDLIIKTIYTVSF